MLGRCETGEALPLLLEVVDLPDSFEKVVDLSLRFEAGEAPELFPEPVCGAGFPLGTDFAATAVGGLVEDFVFGALTLRRIKSPPTLERDFETRERTSSSLRISCQPTIASCFASDPSCLTVSKLSSADVTTCYSQGNKEVEKLGKLRDFKKADAKCTR